MVGVVAIASPKEMEEEPSLCNLSLAVDCTLSLGSTLSRTVEAPASRLSRAGSPDPDLALSLSVRSERVDGSRRHTVEHDRSDQDMSWGSSCIRSDSDATPEYYPQVSERVARVGDGAKRSFKAWPRSSAQSYKDEVNTSKTLFGMIDDHKYSNRVSRQPWLSNYLPSSAVVEAKVASRVEQCMQEGDSFSRVCAHCGTSKTPLWRNGPGGPKSLCNACGIRFKKAGRRSAANGGSDSQVSPPVSTKVAKRKLVEDEQQYWLFPADAKPRKRSRGTAIRTSDSLLSGSCMTWQSSLLYSPKSPLQRDFPASPPSESEEKKELLEMGSFSSDEEEGAVLLMALSCGMVNA
ncbi:hypothetical protein M758_8G168500 [Ceratodon purpureus]|uniref:GATA-type domain-containing protein n=1 Tax=Ceratodon purpureus TaxID=3225 RepID=A0A8T0H1I9_CERPU|nr:hypothetical protein KC19_8G173600 [Ceratodon purpureus]KAG0609232.1 hypothetical protein M758_8G168500 [Ceratodon purpureus]